MKLLDQTHTNVNESLHLSHTLIIWVVVPLCTITGEGETPIYYTANKSLKPRPTVKTSLTSGRSSPHYTWMCYKVVDAAAWIK